MAHAYFVVGELEEGIESAHIFAETEFGLATQANPDVMTLRHGLLSVEDARRLQALAELAPVVGDTKVLVVSASRLFHEAQNAMLKLFEEPPAGTVLILVIPSEGMLLPTLRSRLVELPQRESVGTNSAAIPPIAQEFISAKPAEREKIISKLLDRTKSDKDDEKQAARLVAIQLLEGLMQKAHEKLQNGKEKKDGVNEKELRGFLDDSLAFIPILHERSAPLKLIFEHVLLTVPF